MIRLLPPAGEAGFVGPMAVPAELYFVAREPAALAGMAYPARVDWRALHDAGIGHVVCLTHSTAPYDAAPLTVSAYALEDLYARPSPTDPERERALVIEAAKDVATRVAAGTGVVVHCRGGRGRAGAVLGCALVMLGERAPDVVEYLDRLHVRRGKGGWPETRWQADTVLRCPAASRERASAPPARDA